MLRQCFLFFATVSINFFIRWEFCAFVYLKREFRSLAMAGLLVLILLPIFLDCNDYDKFYD